MAECFCDFDQPSVYQRKAIGAARKAHRCSECAGEIAPGEAYERTFGIWDGRADTFCTCRRCLDLREWVAAHVPCFCWEHGNMREGARDTAAAWSHEAPGLLFGALRREVLIRRSQKWKSN